MRVVGVFLSLLVTWIRAQCAAGDQWSCESQGCCPAGDGPKCVWVEYYFRRKRGDDSNRDNESGLRDNGELSDTRPLTGVALELNQLYHLNDERNFTRFINGEVPVLPRHVALRDKL